MNRDVIAVDGPSASGKSTVARRVATALDWLYVDSGALYRGVTWKALEEEVATDDAGALSALMERVAVTFHVVDGAVRFRIDGRELDQELRSDRINANVSPVAAVAEVRCRIVAWLRDMAALGNLVVEGRDIGTAVFPDAVHKFYLDASAEERARRRHMEIVDRSEGADLADVGRSLQRRDRIDSGRRVDPLRVAPNATVIDSTGLGIDDVVSLILGTVRGESASG